MRVKTPISVCMPGKDHSLRALWDVDNYSYRYLRAGPHNDRKSPETFNEPTRHALPWRAICKQNLRDLLRWLHQRESGEVEPGDRLFATLAPGALTRAPPRGPPPARP